MIKEIAHSLNVELSWDYVATIIAIISLTLAGISLAYTILTLKSQRQTEANTTRIMKPEIQEFLLKEILCKFFRRYFSKFREYSHLKGQFGYGLENCLLDFSTFPGPIVLTKNSLHNIENFYRGRLFTTDYTTSPKGIIKIENNDFQKVIESSYDSKGFKRGKVCEKIEIGYNFENFIKTFNEKIETKKYDRIFLLAQDDFSVKQKAYFEKLIKLSSKNTLIISFSYKSDLDNFIYINMCFDYFSLIRIFDYIYKSNLPITIFIPKCHRDSISQMVYFASLEKVKLFLGNCTSIILNPALLKTLEEFFNISLISTVKKDLEQII